MWSTDIKLKAMALRKEGLTLSEIVNRVKVPKSTLSGWVREIGQPNHLYFTNREEWLEKIRPLANAKRKKTRTEKVDRITQRVKAEVARWDIGSDIPTQKSILSFLYWAEGAKLPEKSAPVRFANTDPRLILLFVTLLRNCYRVDPKKIKVKLYLHWYHDQVAVKSFWQKLLGIPESQFGKIYLKHRSKTKRFRKNFMGICFVTYASVDLRHEIMQTAYALQAKILAVNAPIV